MKEVKPPKKPLIFYYAAAMLAVGIVALLERYFVRWRGES